MNESKRQQKVAKLLQKDLGDIFQRDVRGILGGAFVTIADVKITPDLSIAMVYISMMLVKDKEELVKNAHQVLVQEGQTEDGYLEEEDQYKKA